MANQEIKMIILERSVVLEVISFYTNYTTLLSSFLAKSVSLTSQKKL